MGTEETKSIAHYRIVRKLGEGGMGEVYLAEDTRLERQVALKLLPQDVAQIPSRRQRFLTEAKAASALNHPSICTVYDVGEACESQLYISMELLEGQTLDCQVNDRQLTIEEIVDIGFQVADALDAAHRKSVVHRDIKLSNISMNERGQVKVLDFGLAKRTLADDPVEPPTSTHTGTQSGQLLGTPSYMSPEQALGKAVDHRTDIFSLGVVLYRLLTGLSPFAGGNVGETIEKITHVQPEAIARFNYELPPELDRITRKCLEKNVNDRYQSARDLMVDLRMLKRELGGDGQEIASTKSADADAKKSIAVLPFKNLSSDPDSEFFSDGITEDLISALSRIEGLQVPSSSSSFTFKGKTEDSRRVGERLGVSAVLEGSVRKAENRLRINAQLVNVEDGYQLWSERFDRELKDVFEIQDEITHAILAALRLRLVSDESTVLVKAPTDNTKAYQLYLEGRHNWSQRGLGLQKALRYFELALLEDPNYALAHAGLADTLNLLGLYGFVPPKEGFPKSKKHAKKAIEITSGLAEGYSALGVASLYFDWKPELAAKEFRKAIELNANHIPARNFLAIYHITVGEIDAAVAEDQKALEVDPLSNVAKFHLGWLYYFAGKYDQAINHLAILLEVNPEFMMAHFGLGMACLEKGQHEEALSRFEKAILHSGRWVQPLAWLGYAQGLSGRIDQANQTLDELVRRSEEGYVPPGLFAMVCAGLDDEEKVFEWLQRGLEDRDSMMQSLHFWPPFQRYRSKERFQALLNEVGIAATRA